MNTRTPRRSPRRRWWRRPRRAVIGRAGRAVATVALVWLALTPTPPTAPHTVRPVVAATSVVVLAQAATVDQVLTNIRTLILGVAGGAALVCWSVAGLRMMFSQGDPGEVAKARSAFRAGAVGFAVVILAPLALAVLRTVVGQ